MHHFKDSGLENVWLQDGYRTGTDKFGSYVSIDDIPGLYRAIAIALAHGGGFLCAGGMRLLRQQLDMTQKELAEKIGRSEQTILLWERSAASEKTRIVAIPEDAARLVKLMVLEKLCEGITLSSAFHYVNQLRQDRIVMRRSNGRWDSAINGVVPVAVHLCQEWGEVEEASDISDSGNKVNSIIGAREIAVSDLGGPQWTH